KPHAGRVGAAAQPGQGGHARPLPQAHPDGVLPAGEPTSALPEPVFRRREHPSGNRRAHGHDLRTPGRAAHLRAAAIGTAMIERVVLVAPRGFCAGVARAVALVEWALATLPHPVYV